MAATGSLIISNGCFQRCWPPKKTLVGEPQNFYSDHLYLFGAGKNKKGTCRSIGALTDFWGRPIFCCWMHLLPKSMAKDCVFQWSFFFDFNRGSRCSHLENYDAMWKKCKICGVLRSPQKTLSNPKRPFAKVSLHVSCPSTPQKMKIICFKF